MSSSRTKRKRSEADISGISAPASLRRRTRDQRLSGAEPSEDGVAQKNETENILDPSSTDNEIGESSAAGIIKNAQAPQHTGASQEDSARTTEPTFSAPRDETNDENTHENDANATGSSTTAGTRILEEFQKSLSSNGELKEGADGNKSTNASDKGTTNRANQFRSMISHRKLLLERVRQGRSAAQTRIADLAHYTVGPGESKNAKTSESPGGISAATDLSEKAKDDAEIASFKRLSRSAVQAAKKQRSEKNETAEKRVVSLRRGASVGKKMNAALSSLAPGHASVGSLPPDVSATQPLHLSSAGESNAMIRGPPAPIAAQRPATTSNIRLAAQQPPPLTNANRMKSSFQLGQNPNRLPQQPFGFTVDSGQPKNSRLTGQKLPTRGLASTSAPQMSALPLHAGIPKSELPPNRLAMPSTVCPEAIALREARYAIRSKLVTHLKERQERIERIHKPQATPTKTASQPSPGSSAYSPSFHSLSKGLSPSTYFPRRRKTHWDSVLEEMRWLATDFIEERKWKESAARILSSAVIENGTKAVAATSATNAEQGPDPIAPAEPSEGQSAELNKVGKKSAISKQGPPRMYVAPNAEDAAASRRLAKVISSMAYELSSATIDAGAFAQSDRIHMKSLKRHLVVRKQLEKPKTDIDEPIEEEEKPIESRSAKDEIEPSAEDGKEEHKMGSFERINKVIEGLLGTPQKGGRKPPKRKADTGRRADAEDVSLTASQLEAIDIIERRWGNKHHPGAILTGPKSSGKTTALCSLLWKNRSKGPQLLICSPTRVMKWVHELDRFKGLRICYLGLSGGISSPFSKIEGRVNFEENEVVVCEFSEVKSIHKTDFKHFETMIVDCRYPRGFLGSRLPSVARMKVVPHRSDSPSSTAIPIELGMESWWESLTEAVADCAINRALVENAGPEMFDTCLADKATIQQLEIIAFRAALVMGPQIFASSKSSIKKRILTWARRKTKELDQSTKNRLQAVKNFLLDSVHPFHCEIRSDGILEEASHMLGKKLEYEVRLCDLSADEKSEYEKCCAASRGALSAQIYRAKEGNTIQENIFSAVSDALLRLRRQCVHARMNSLYNSISMRLRLGGYPSFGVQAPSDSRLLSRKVNDNPSQTDVDLALRILEGSAKLRELISILSSDCGYSFEGELLYDSLLAPDSPRKGKTSNERNPSKKIAILAILPEVQILVSVLLNSLGVAHELLLRPSSVFSPCENEISVALPAKQTNAATLSWIECQQALSRFNSFASSKSPSASMLVSNVLVTSPEIVAGDHGGIGIDAADFVVCLDEDWSGRGELIMRSMMAGLTLRNMRAKDRGCQVIRLVCGDTCEEVFLSTDSGRDSDNKKTHVEAWPWPFDPFGRFINMNTSQFTDSCDFESWPFRRNYDEIFAFPGVNLFHFRDRDLSYVLCADIGIPSRLNSGSSISFLPYDNSGSATSEKKSEMLLLMNLMEKEENARGCFKEAGIISENLSSLRSAAFTRQDLNVIAVRLYLEQFGKALVLKELAAGSEPMPSLVPADVILATPADSARAVLMDDGSNVDEPWHRGRFGGKAGDYVSSLLFYDAFTGARITSPQSEDTSEQDDRHRMRQETAESPQSWSTPFTSPRSNHYVTAFEKHTRTFLHDGHQGMEALIYCPPLFPGLMQCAVQAKHDINAICIQKAQEGKTAPDRAGLKRSAEPVDVPAAKRPKVQGSPDASDLGMVMKRATVVTEDEASHSDAATFLLELDEDFGLAGIGAIPLPKDSAVAASNNFVEVSSQVLDLDHLATGLDWLSGFIPCDEEEMGSFRTGQKERLFLNSVILFVERKKQRGFAPLPGAPTQVYRPTPNVAAADSSSAAEPSSLPLSIPKAGADNGVFHDINGGGNSKNFKKKGPSSFAKTADGLSPAAHNTAQTPTNIQMVKAKDIYRNRILSFLTSRQKAMGMTLFESPAYRVAAIRFRNRVNDRMPRHSWTSSTAWNVGPGLPLVLAKDANFSDFSHVGPTLWTSIVKGLRDENSRTGDDARALAGSQRISLTRSLVAPCRVDFGPFQAGFLSAPSGMTGVPPTRTHTGITLPMGVKIPLIKGEQLQAPWTDDEDHKLQNCVLRFGMNWILAARTLEGLDGVVISSKIEPKYHRSPRECHDRWQALTRSPPSLTKIAQNTEHGYRGKAINAELKSRSGDSCRRFGSPVLAKQRKLCLDSEDIEQKDSLASDSFIFPAKRDLNVVEMSNKGSSAHKVIADETQDKAKSEETQMDVDTMEADTNVGSKSRSLASVLAAREKKEVIPMTIPGVAPGNQPTFSASHPSHVQTVQSSIAASWTNGRTEMWPLQFLDVAEKQRAASASANAAPTSTGAPSSGSRTPSTSATRTPGASPPGSSSTNRIAHKLSSSRVVASAKPRTPPHQQKGPVPTSYYAPYPGSAPPPPHGAHPYPHPHYQRPTGSPATRPPNAVVHTYTAHTPVSHTQQLHSDAAKQKTPPSSGKKGNSSSRAPLSAASPVPAPRRSPPPTPANRPTQSPAPAPNGPSSQSPPK